MTRILISSSRQWNPGDEFILRGARRLLEAVLPQPINWVLWNRNPDLFVDRWANPRFKPNFLTNSAVEPSLDVIDAVCLAGTPEWFGPSVERIYRELLRFPDVPLLALGIGGCGPGFQFALHEREVFARENSLIVCRNPVLAEEINQQLGAAKAVVLPCPAFLSAGGFVARAEDELARCKLGIQIQGDVVENQGTATKYVEWLKHRFFTGSPRTSDLSFVAHYIDEFLSFARLGARQEIFYSYEPLDYLDYYAKQIRALVASRLHGALAAMSCGTPAVLVNVQSKRLVDAAVPFEGLLPTMEYEEAMTWLGEATPESLAKISGELMGLKQRTWDKYLALLQPFVERCML